jgi:hypothetical protein
VVNGAIPEEMPQGLSFSAFLQSVSVEEGLQAEIAFRRHHFESMESWDYEDNRCIEFRYEDMLGKEDEAFVSLLDHYRWSGKMRTRVLRAVGRNRAAARIGRTAHIRDPAPRQWEHWFTATVEKCLQDRHPNLLQKAGYA